MNDSDNELAADRIPGLTREERAAALGISYREHLDLERFHPWAVHWAALIGHGTANLRAWIAAGSPTPDREALCIAGEQPLVDAFRCALDQVPNPAAWHVVRCALVICGGAGSAGSWCSLPAMPAAPSEERHLIQLHVDDEGVAGHEMGHAFTMQPAPFRSRLTAARCEEITAAAVGLTVMRGEVEAWRRAHDQLERAADHLCSLWLRRPFDSTSSATFCQRRREDFDSNVARQLERAGGTFLVEEP